MHILVDREIAAVLVESLQDDVAATVGVRIETVGCLRSSTSVDVSHRRPGIERNDPDTSGGLETRGVHAIKDVLDFFQIVKEA